MTDLIVKTPPPVTIIAKAAAPKGDAGAPGADGADGASAYDVAVANGFSGTETEWLASLIGPAGATGPQGDTGPTGATGATGSAGADGADGVGVPAGGTAGQVLAKASNTDYDTEWVNQSGGSTTFVRGAAWANPDGVALPTNNIEIRFPAACTIAAVYIDTNGGTGSCVIDIQKSGVSICGSTKPTISSGFPSSSYQSSNYWVDVVFTTSTGGGDTSAVSIWPASAVPGNPSTTETGAVELGVKFRSDVSGYVTGIRFYKGSTNTGTHIGNLWTTGGANLATANFSNETASGWQQVNFATPVAIVANTDYVASYHAPNGRYAFDPNFFTSTGVDNAPLHALSNAAAGGNGVYRYGATSYSDTTLTGWATNISAGDVLTLILESASGAFEFVGLSLVMAV